MFRQQLTEEQAFQKLKHFCAWQERCHSEVKEKAFSLGLRKAQADELVSRLIEENYLNEERFARQFAGGKFRMKQWGRIKIQHELKQRKISAYCIQKAMEEIEENTYLQTLEKLAFKKWNSIRGAGTNLLIKMKKTTDYLLQKGYEPELIQKTITKLKK
jgi:regulatory protein